MTNNNSDAQAFHLNNLEQDGEPEAEFDGPDEDELAVPQRGGFKASVEHYHSIPVVTVATPTSELDNFFNELLAEGEAESDDSFLDDLLAESVQAVEGKAKLKLNRKKLQDTRLTGVKRAELEADTRFWELAREWRAVANVVIFNTQYCTCCGSQHSTMSGFFQRQNHRQSKISRWQAVSKMDDSLARESKHTETEVEVCVDCASACAWVPEAGCRYTPSRVKQDIAEVPRDEVLEDGEVEGATDGTAEELAAIDCEIAEQELAAAPVVAATAVPNFMTRYGQVDISKFPDALF